MPSFDIVSEINMQEVDNAVNNLQKELATRFDFRGSETEIDFNKKDKVITMVTSDDMKMRALREMLISNALKRGIDSKSLEFGEVEKAGGAKLKRTVKLKEGIEKDEAKKITALIKGSGLKVQSSIMDDKVRVTGKKIDDLQEVIKLMKEGDFAVPLQYINMKS